ncbi:hypothetical protein [Paracoccus laeviglucosivorans]|uniref:Uncharacterized protein n=1 Tax=Paracoccus laeviglucosivorans TaxID=1197861 RepID=A0A521CH03_9RHOB|nr:hypothetical protein [Paracoccus laeviglucosivorans]SMO58031.1 hypothetical protein SAMN06265221_104259 [Paracoccus laeviglucosivorans]
MEIAALIAITIFALYALIGAGRAQSLQPRRIVLPVGTALGAALACYLIGETKTAGFLAGIIGVLGMIIMLIAAAGLTIGWLTVQAPMRFRVIPSRNWPVSWDLIVTALLGAACTFCAAIE